jgi:hypothetical protein
LAEELPQTDATLREALDRLDWERCEVDLEVIEKEWFGLFHKDFLTLEKWVARRHIILRGIYADRASFPIIAERAFSVDTRMGEDYTEIMTQAFEELMGKLFEKGWELSEDATPYTRPIFLHHPPLKKYSVKKYSSEKRKRDRTGEN